MAIESWRSEEAVDAVRGSEGFKQAVTALMGCCNKPMQMEVFADIGNDHSAFDLYPTGKSQVHREAGAIRAHFICGATTSLCAAGGVPGGRGGGRDL